MKKWIGALGVLLISIGAMAQNHHWCGFDHHNNQLLQESQAARDNQQRTLENIHQRVEHLARRDGDKIVVPTVVHVAYSECGESISDAQVWDAMRILNEDMARTNEDASETRAVFEPFAKGSDIEFRLARIDPDGDPTTGISRTQTSLAIDANNNIKNVIPAWSTDKYFNIWVVESIYPFTGTGGTILGYAQFPGNGSWSNYGIVIRNDAMGTIGTSTADGRTLTHEVGHCLSLLHTFQSGCGGSCNNSGDFICDTPPAFEATYNCSGSTNTCSNDLSGSSVYNTNVPDQIENYMSYNSCQNMFTEDQMIVAENTLTGGSFPRLVNMVSQENLEATGVAGLVSADFNIPTPIICAQSTINFNSAAMYTASEFSWELGPNAVPGTSELENPEVSFWEPGIQTIEFTASNGGSSKSTTQSVFVVDHIGQGAPFDDEIEGFTSSSNDNWFVVNPDKDAVKWELNNNVGYQGDQSYWIENFDLCGPTIEELYTKSFDFSNLNTATIKFRTAYAQKESGNNDILRVYTSTDCGENWNLTWVRNGAQLAAGVAPTTGSYIPSGNGDWNSQSFTLTGNRMTEGVTFRFEFTSDGGNNIFLDDFEVDGDFSGEQLLRSPFDGKQGLASDVLIDWKSAGFVTGYEYEVDTDNTFSSSNKISGTTTSLGSSGDLSDTEMLLEDLEVNTTYYWRVRNFSGTTNSDWSQTWSFTISETGVGFDENPIVPTYKVFPNPASSAVNIEGSEDIQAVQLIDFTGRIVTDMQQVNGKALNLDVSSMESGVYFVVITSQAGDRTVERLVID